MTITTERPAHVEPARRRGPLVQRTIGELLITLGLVMLLFVVYEVWFTDLETARDQRKVTTQLHHDWSRGASDKPTTGHPFTRLYIPRFGADYAFTVIEGVGLPQLAKGPGHYPGSALPGHRGNFALAGHRIGRGAPFNDLPDLNACDAIVLETRHAFFVYRVLPMADQIDDWTSIRRDDARCAHVPALTKAPYRHVYGRSIVTPDRVDVVNPVPNAPRNVLPRAKQRRLLTLTTCNPEFDNYQRLIVHAILADRVAKSDVATYPRLVRRLDGER